MDEKQLQALLEASNTEIKNLHAKSLEEMKTLGATATETKEALAKAQAEMVEMRKQLDAIDERTQRKNLSETAEKPIGEVLKENDDVQRMLRQKSGRAQITFKGYHAEQIRAGREWKTTMTSDNVGSTPRQTTGVLAIERDGGITAEARRQLRIRQLLSERPTSMQVVDYVKVANALANAANQSPEGAAKDENALTFSSASERIKTIATYIPATRQLLEDMPELESFIRTGLAYYVAKETEEQILSGNGVSETLNGIIPQATAFNTALLPSGGTGSWTAIDVIGWAIAQVAIADEVTPTFVVLNPTDWWDIRMTKDSQGRYILGNPWTVGVPDLFGATPVPTTAMTAGTFLVGSGDPAATEIRNRMDIVVDISTEDGDNFKKNLVTVRAEERLALVTKRPASFITGSLASSPA